MSDYTAFAEVVERLPARIGTEHVALKAFGVRDSESPFIDPVLTTFEAMTQPSVTFISARGATGKSTMAEELSRRLQAPLWSLNEDKAVSGDALAARLGAYLNVVDPLLEAPRHVPVLIIDALDEARMRVTGVSWDEFVDSLAQFAAAGIHLVLMGRQRTVEDVWYSLSEQVATISWYEISHFTPEQQSAYVDLRALGDNASSARNEAYSRAKEVVLQALNGATHTSLNETFAGYAPVLDAVAKLLRPGENYQNVANKFQGSAAGGSRLDVLRNILDTLLRREQVKVVPLARQLGLDQNSIYTPAEQLSWLAAQLLGSKSPKLDWCPKEKRDEYVDRIQEFLFDHPFRDGDKWASPVFSSFVAFQRRDVANPEALAHAASASGLLFEFAAAECHDSPLIVDEQQFAALNASLLAGQWADLTTNVSIRVDSWNPGQTAETVKALLTLSQSDSSETQLVAEVLLSSPGTLELVSPLTSIDVDFGGRVVVSTRTASIDIGPDVYIHADSVELEGVSMHLSNDTGASDLAGPAVEVEVHSGFQSSARLIGNVTAQNFTIVAPASLNLTYPWVQFRTEPDEDTSVNSPDDRARRFLNKLMSLARKHGHIGQRAVYIKKLQGRQGLEPDDFKRAIQVLVTLGVAEIRNDMLFISGDWDEHRYDGKGRAGMTSYEDKKEYWRPVLNSISEALH